MKLENPLVDRLCLLEKYPGKGGWTYTKIPEIPQDKKAHFGWVSVCGSIDSFELQNYKLMPMGNGQLFLPVRAAIRKTIGKTAGDYVHVILYLDHTPLVIPEALLLCLKDEPKAYSIFLSYSEGEQKVFIDWIYSAKKEETRAERIAATLEKVLQHQKLAIKKP